VKWIQETVHAITYKGKRAALGTPWTLRQRERNRENAGVPGAAERLLDALPIAVIGMQARRIVLANHAVEDVFGWKPEELIGRGTRVLYRTDEDYEQIGKNVYRTLKKQRTFKTEFPCRRKGGKNIVCSVSVARIGDSLQTTGSSPPTRHHGAQAAEKASRKANGR